MLRTIASTVAISGLMVMTSLAQVPPSDKSATPAHASPGAQRRTVNPQVSCVDAVIQLVKGGMSEPLVLRTLKGGKPVDLTPADMLKLQKAGVSENIIKAMLDPASARASTVPSDAATPSTPPKITTSAGVVSTSTATPFPPAFGDAPPGPRKRRLAVMPFDYSAVKTWVTFWFGNDVNIGQGIRAMLTTRLQQSKTITLLERTKVNDVMREQDFGATNRVNQGTKAKIGKMTGADAILFGDIVIFGRDDVTKGKAVGAALGGTLGALATFKREEKAVVGINLRIVDAETGEVLETAEARGQSSRKSNNWGGLLAGNKGITAVDSNMTSSNFEETIIGEATSDAVNKIIAWLDQRIPQVVAKSRTIEGRVASFSGSSMYISVGANEGVQPGDRFEIHQINNEVIDPETKQVLDKETVKVGEFVVHSVREKVAIGEYGGQPLSATYAKGYAARLMVQ